MKGIGKISSKQMLGRFLREHLFDQSYRCHSCDMPSEAHVHCYTHRQGTLTISVKKLPDIILPGEREGKIWMWHRCLRCPRNYFYHCLLQSAKETAEPGKTALDILELNRLTGFAMADDALQLIPAAVLVYLSDKLYEKRKNAALEIENIVKQLAIAGDHDKITAVIKLLAKDFIQSSQGNCS